ncbi:MAG: UDP-N-acetylmuramyl pentapeptide phosphotransferase/UDP-N-acetylglucosamine-phosphate transferase, partial [Actinomycetia bacterium]|nr:UDP-N-acetylmuramyl pentapeptide phosphotransferase/UDP-N-acetylglucosamine-phosphate transferase [Actinomycetes bacterium]
GRLTTGGLKLFAGGAPALIASAAVDGDSVGRLVVDAALIALAANLANLFDRAPGRTLKVGGLCFVVLAAVAGFDRDLAGVAVAMGALLALARADLGERLMIGDTGANPVGAVLALGLVLVVPFWGRVLALAVVLGCNLLSEVVSFSSVIDRVAPLRWVDRAGRPSGYPELP